MKTLQQIDTEIAQLEQRREWVNHLDLNKRVIRDEDFAYRCVDTLRTVQCVHAPTKKTSCQSFSGVEFTLAIRKAQAAVSSELLAEGWVHAS